MSIRVLTLRIEQELDVVASRQRARQIAALCGFNAQDQARIATAVSELARNVYSYAGNGRVEFAVEGTTSPQLLVIRIEDKGPGIPHLDLVLSGRYQSRTGMGMGIIGARRLMDQFDIQTATDQGAGTGTGTAVGTSTGTTITLKKLLPHDAPLLTAASVGEMSAQFAALAADVSVAEVQQQNKELLATLAELKTRQDELMQLTRELEDTNRGVVALYAELDEKADHLRRADEMKTRFLSNMSHEFRTPLSSIRALTRLLLERVDGELTPEQEKQVRFILKGAESLTELVDDLLDLAKIEAGKIDVRAAPFEVNDMFSALRGMLRPLLVSSTVELLFDEPEGPITMMTDEAKVSQILRNFISNALKFTEAGHVRVSATLLPKGDAVRFEVADTGIGIAPEHQQLIFEEFSQVENRLQHRVKGTGLGLPLCRRLANLLGGSVSLRSAPGAGSTFSATIPLLHDDMPQPHVLRPDAPDAAGIPVLVVEDDRSTQLLYRSYLRNTGYRVIAARSVWEAEQAWAVERPAAIILDLYLNGGDSWRWLARIKDDEHRKHVPVIIASEVADRQKAFSLGADAYFSKPVARDELLAQLNTLCHQERPS
ncbi:ATP-binding protein [Pseudoduganella umbonata]|uniref:histidine kinase n=1 Tax=Pseudoduganella umbonata TaxID=864828 RepID=A0A4P8HXW8_9BURK|nr:ATP-binding protein [Pseudoduganella umbonata]MBB3223617.1 signal transduction histidine kinase/CheY-like chemotaxis protein [Pseudoduganella umbonata]QCP13520.1 response regulator [Pseudoduganella umbonata]